MISSALEDIEATTLQLAPSERAHLAERLLVSLDEDDEILASWVEEAERRGDAFDRGEMGAIDFDESIARLKAKLASRSAPSPTSAAGPGIGTDGAERANYTRLIKFTPAGKSASSTLTS